MDHRQEIILDRLAGAKRIGVQYGSGPLGIAVEALVEKKLVHRSDAKAALGFPRLLCQGFQGANNQLPGIEERRTLAVTFFSAVRPCARAPTFAARRHAEIALWAARRVHPMVCREDCPSLLVIERWIAGNPSVDDAVPREVDNQNACAALTTPEARALLHTQAFFKNVLGHATSALRYVRFTVTASRPGETSHYATLHAGAAAALHGGAAVAADFCIGLARELGL